MTFKSISHQDAGTVSIGEVTVDLAPLLAELKSMRMCLERRAIMEPPVVNVTPPAVYVTVPEVTIPPWLPWPEFKAKVEIAPAAASFEPLPWNKILWVTGGLWVSSFAGIIGLHFLGWL